MTAVGRHAGFLTRTELKLRRPRSISRNVRPDRGGVAQQFAPILDRTIDTQSVTGSGTLNRFAKWTGTTSIGNSILLTESGSYFGVGTNSPQRELHMLGVLRIDRSNTPGMFLHQLGQKTFFVGVQATSVNREAVESAGPPVRNFARVHHGAS